MSTPLHEDGAPEWDDPSNWPGPRIEPVENTLRPSDMDSLRTWAHARARVHFQRCWDEACEGLARAHGRPGLHAIPPALALGIANRETLREVLTGAVRGYEMAARLGERMRIQPGMHVDGTWGTFGATFYFSSAAFVFFVSIF